METYRLEIEGEDFDTVCALKFLAEKMKLSAKIGPPMINGVLLSTRDWDSVTDDKLTAYAVSLGLLNAGNGVVKEFVDRAREECIRKSAIGIIKLVRNYTGMGLKESKDLVDTLTGYRVG